MAKRKIGLGGQLPKGGSFQPVGRPEESVPQPEQVQQVGGENSLPLPVGRPVAVDAKKLTPKEREDLETIGWEPGMAIPDNLADWIDQAKQSSTDPSYMPPPIDPTTPPVKVPAMVDLKDLPEDKRRELQALLQQTQQQQAVNRREAATTPLQPGQGVAEAIRVAGGEGREIQIEDDVSSQDPRQQLPDLSRPKKVRASETLPPKNKPSEPESEPQLNQTPETPVQPETASAHPGVCPNCSWDLSRQDVAEATESDKQNFLAATLGNTAFQKIFELFGGQMQVTFRSLEPYEVDACYKQCYLDRQRNQIASTEDFFEQVTRYRFALQLVEIRSGEDLTQFPASLREWSQQDTAPAGTLPNILDSIFDSAVSSESMYRILSQTCQHFNRIIAHLEANIENADFWKAVVPIS